MNLGIAIDGGPTETFWLQATFSAAKQVGRHFIYWPHRETYTHIAPRCPSVLWYCTVTEHHSFPARQTIARYKLHSRLSYPHALIASTRIKI